MDELRIITSKMHELVLIVGFHLDDHVQCTFESMLKE